MNGFADVVGQAGAIELLRRLLQSGRLPHALLFQGPEAVGKATVARAFTAALLCPRAESPCGACEDCRLLEAGNHPDSLLVTRLARRPGAEDAGEDEGDLELKSVITVEQIREVTHLASRTARRAARRVFRIDPADRMNPEAQNALLKTLEEPAGPTLVILVSSRPHLLLPTVRSRCVVVRFAAVRPIDLGRLLAARGVPENEAVVRAALSEGRPGLALTLDLDACRERRDAVLGAVERLASGGAALAELGRFVEPVAGSSEETLGEGLELLETILRDAARSALAPGDPAVQYVDVRPRLERLGDALGAARAAALVRSIDVLRGQLRFHLNQRLVAESVLAAIAGGPLP